MENEELILNLAHRLASVVNAETGRDEDDIFNDVLDACRL